MTGKKEKEKRRESETMPPLDPKCPFCGRHKPLLGYFAGGMLTPEIQMVNMTCGECGAIVGCTAIIKRMIPPDEKIKMITPVRMIGGGMPH
jgi:transcription elongation factor Elf1